MTRRSKMGGGGTGWVPKAREALGGRAFRRLRQILTNPARVPRALAQRLLGVRQPPTYAQQLAAGALVRPHYGYCIFQAARLACLLDYPKVGVIEFGCGGGNGLIDAELHIREIQKLLPIEIELYGFDTGSGLPAPHDYRDMPHYFKSGLYPMDRDRLSAKLSTARLVIGDVKDTCTRFFEEYAPAPIGCIFFDLDYYSSTRDALRILDHDPSHFLPRLFTYFDDILGDNTWLCNEFTGERLAIEEFNRDHEHQKFSKCAYLPFLYPAYIWPHLIFAYHDFRHPRYNEYIGDAAQVHLEKMIRLR